MAARFSASAVPVRAQNRKAYIVSSSQPAILPVWADHRRAPIRIVAQTAAKPATALGTRTISSFSVPVTAESAARNQ